MLEQYVAVAEELHFGHAARRLRISQPPLSQAIMRLEQTLNVELLKRSNRTVELTDAGRTFLREAYRLLELESVAVAHTRAAGAGLASPITLGFVGSVSYGLLPELLAGFRKLHVQAVFDLRELTSVEQLRELEARRLDAGIVRLPLCNANGMGTKIIRHERMVVALPKNHLLCALKTVPLARLADERFIAFPPDRVMSLYAKTLLACHAAGFSPRIATHAWQMPTMAGLVAAGLGVALLPAQIKNLSQPGVVYRELEDSSEHLNLEIALAWRPDDCPAMCRKFIESIPFAPLPSLRYATA